MIRLPAEGRSARSSPPGGLPEGFDAITELVLVVVDVVTVIFAERGARENRARIRRSAVGPREGRRRRKNGFRPPARLTADDERPSYITRIVPAPLLQASDRPWRHGSSCSRHLLVRTVQTMTKCRHGPGGVTSIATMGSMQNHVPRSIDRRRIAIEHRTSTGTSSDRRRGASIAIGGGRGASIGAARPRQTVSCGSGAIMRRHDTMNKINALTLMTTRMLAPRN